MEEILYLVVPCYNEEAVLRETAKRLLEKINKMINKRQVSKESKILFVNDGSKDRTWEIIEELYNKDSIFSGVNLSRNRGHQNALLAGLMVAKEYADMVISLDADLQDDIDVIEKFVEEYYSGSDIVYGVRSSRETDTFFKRIYPLKNMFAFALDGITSFSIKPIRLISVLGCSIFFVSLIALIYSLVVKFLGKAETGWTSLVISIWMIGGIQLLSLGVIGEYIGKIYNETKARPRYIIKNKLISNKDEKINEYYGQE